MGDLTNRILSALYRLGRKPKISLTKQKEAIGVTVEAYIGETRLVFDYNYGGHTVRYGVYYNCYRRLTREELVELYRLFRTDDPYCFSTLSEDAENRCICITEEKFEGAINLTYIECIIEEIQSMKVIDKIEEIIDFEEEV